MSAYVIAHFRVNDSEGYAAYSAKAIPTIAAHGGTTLAADDTVVDLCNGRPNTRMILISFPTRSAAQAWIESPEYKAVADERVQATETFSSLLVEGLG